MFAVETEITVELVKLVPTILWIVVVVTIVLLFRTMIRDRLEGFEAFGVKATFVRSELDRAAQEVVVGDAADRSQVARRAARLARVIRGAKVLIVDDQPAGVRYVENILQQLGVGTTTARSTDEALKLLNRDGLDAVISDMRRGEVGDEGKRFLAEARRRGIARPTVFYVGRYDPELGTPPFAVGITNRVDELLHLVLDALERVRG